MSAARSPFSYPSELWELVRETFLSEKEMLLQFDSPRSARSFRTKFNNFKRSIEDMVLFAPKANLEEEDKKTLREIYAQAQQLECLVEDSAAIVRPKSNSPAMEVVRRALDAGPRGETARVTNRQEEENQATVARLIEKELRKLERSGGK